MSSKYANLKIPWSLAKQADALLEIGGYTSRSDFAQDAMRRRIEELKRLWDQKQKTKALSDNQKCQLETWAEPYGKQLREMSREELVTELTPFFQDWSAEEIASAVEYLLEWISLLPKN